MVFFLLIKKNLLPDFCSLIEDSVYRVIASFEEIILKTNFLFIFNLVITFLVFSSYYKM